jgi:hypothetical protein
MFFILLDSPFGRFRNVLDDQVRVTFAEPPNLQPALNAARQ